MPTKSDKVPSCCCCLNVRYGSYFLAGLVMGGGICTVIAACMLLSNSPNAMQYEFKFSFNNLPSSRTAQWLSLGTGICFVIISLMAVYGLVKSKGTYLIPMFLMQIFAFICDLVYLGTVLVKWPIVKEYLRECPHMPAEWKEWLQNVDDGWLIALVIFIFFIDLSIKLFFISVVYRCYKHLLMQTLRANQCDPEVPSLDKSKPTSQIYKLPKYEDIQKIPLVTNAEEIDTKPPPYKLQDNA